MTRQQLIDNWHLIEAFKNGADIECKCKNVPYDTWDPAPNISFDFDVFSYRIKSAPKLRPWKPEEVPINCWVRTKQGDLIKWRPLVIQWNGIVFAHWNISNSSPLFLRNFEFLLENMEHSTDGGKTWHPCGIEE